MKKIRFARVREALKGKGFIFALILSVAAVGAATYYAYDSVTSGFGGDVEDDSLFMEVDKNEAEIPKVTPAATSAAPAAAPAETETTPAESETQAANNFFTARSPRTMPAEGEVIQDYSNGELVRSETLNLWQTHDGADIAAAAGTDVKAAGEGTVMNIWEDALWGVCLSIDHGDGYVSSYCGLDINVPVAIGQAVACGDIIGKVGNTAECEIALPSHIHFEVKKDGSYCDPVAFVENE